MPSYNSSSQQQKNKHGFCAFLGRNMIPSFLQNALNKETRK